MDDRELTRKLKKIFADVFDIPEEEIEDESSRDTIENWDSIQHLQLILALEANFGIHLTADEVIEIQTFKGVKDLLKKHSI